MRFRPNGPDIPLELVSAQEKGEVIFVCGAGVSHNAGLPLFVGLVEGVYARLHEDWNLHPAEREVMRPGGSLHGQYDRVLRSLERRLAASDAPRNRRIRERIRAAVRECLAPPDNADLSNHLALLDLSRDAEGRNRILTTNFDTLFERAWFEKYQVAIDTHAGMAMPQPKVAGCTGVLHLHGRISDSETKLRAFDTDLVLTSAEFGDAYLRSGWASRYVYDLVRAYNVVLVGYQADDPPMRYLLEALEADRERYPDLQKVFSFAAHEGGNEELTRALWVAKGVEPILYVANSQDHSALYESIREWRSYAEDPTAWRRQRLHQIVTELPSSVGELPLEECANLLRHGDACQLLGELSPEADWLPVLVERRVFDRDKALPGEWIAKRIDDPAMIRACAALNWLDDQARWQINRALESELVKLPAHRSKAWQLILTAKSPTTIDFINDNWFIVAPKIKRGEVGFEARRLISQILRPQIKTEKTYRWPDDPRDAAAPEALHDLLRLEFDPTDYPSPAEILAAWPQNTEQEISLFRSLDRTLLDALEEAQDIGLIDGWDRSTYDVPSVAAHPQNAYRSGFYPITRTLADLWHRIAERDPDQACILTQPWTNSPFELVQRLSLFVREHKAFAPQDAAGFVANLEDRFFWGHARVEIMRLLVGRWAQFDSVDREIIETRIRQGEPRDLYPVDAFENEGEWLSILDSSIYRRLKRLQSSGVTLTAESQQVLEQISARHPLWEPSEGDRDDFHSWHESRSGPEGEPELLAGIADEQLVKEAMRLQREQHFEQGDIWRIFCAADPVRALRGISLEADKGQWEYDAWRCLLWAATDKGETSFQIGLADLLLKMPDPPLGKLLSAATSWLQRRRELLTTQGRFLQLWDYFADLALPEEGELVEPEESRDLVTEALNRPGGVLAWTLFDALSEPKPERDSGLGAKLKPRFDRLATASGRVGLLARVYLARSLAYLHAIDPEWTEVNLQPRLEWEHPEALPLWRSYAHGAIGSARFFNAIKPSALAAFERQGLSDNDLEGIMSNLLSVAIWHQRGEAADYNLTTAELRRALTVGPKSARQNVSWNFWRLMAKVEDEDGAENPTAPDKATRWQTVIGPLFSDIWPLDARLRSKGASRNLVQMALECDAAFPEAVGAILDVIIPYELYRIEHSLRVEDSHGELVRRFPAAFLKLVNALLDPATFPVPHDLGTLLQECIASDPSVANDPAYIRLNGLRRQRNA